MKKKKMNSEFERTILLLQGGGALGAYHVGVYKSLIDYGYSPDWIICTSIGAVNGAIIAGNKPENRIKKLEKFWDIISTRIPPVPETLNKIFLKKYYNFCSAAWTEMFGQPHFFKPRTVNPWLSFESTPDQLSYYDTSDLRETLNQLINFDLLNEKKIRLSMGSVHVATGNLVYFDNFKMPITVDHIMASCALPPGFPAVCINDQMFWDGGVHSNTQINLLFDLLEPKKTLCFMVQLFDSYGCTPKTMDDIYKRKKDISYSSHHRDFVHAYRNECNLRSVIYELGKHITKNKKNDPQVQKLLELGHSGVIHLARFHYKGKDYELASKDFNFAEDVIVDHIISGYQDTTKLLKNPPWQNVNEKEKGLYLYEVSEFVFEEDKPLTTK